MLPLELDRNAQATLQSQIYGQIRRLIVDGVVRPGMELPSTRALAAQFGIARNTVLAAYDWLLSEGYVETSQGLGTHVSWRLPEECLTIDPSTESDPVHSDRHGRREKVPTIWDTPDLVLPEIDENAPKVDFAPGKINPDCFPVRLVQRYGQDALQGIRKPLSSYRDLAGLAILRQAIADHLSTSRGMRVEAEQIVVTCGIQEALNIVSRLFISAGFKVAVENPCYQSAALVFGSHGATMVPIDVDADGIVVEQLARTKARLLYVTPSHQFPTGATLTLQRRRDLLRWARDTGAYIIEDDYDSDYRYDSPPLMSLAGLDRSDSVIYLGTVSKSLGPGLRIGYLVAPPALAETAVRIKTMQTLGNQYLEQKIVSGFLLSGTYQRHLRRIRKLYLETRDAMLGRLAEHFGPLDIRGKDSGMHLMWTLPCELDDASAISKRVRQYGVQVHTIESAGAKDFGSPYRDRSLIFGYSSLTPDEARMGIDAIAKVAARP